MTLDVAFDKMILSLTKLLERLTSCLQKWAMVCMLSNLAKQKDHSPSMMLSWLPKQNDQVPQENFQKYLTQLLSWSIR